MKLDSRKIIILASALVLCITVFFVVSTCSSKSRAASITSMLDEADRYISLNNPSDALKILSDAEKKIVSPMEAVGIYKRYMLLSETKSAEKVIKKNLKSNPENLELNAVYTYILKTNGDYEKAFSQAEILKGTKYGSLYSELYLKKLLKEKAEQPFEFYLTSDFESIYQAAYTTSRDNAWLRNVALIHLERGEFGAACAVAPETKKSSSDAYFWAAVYYDAEKYEYAAQSLLEAERIAKRNENFFYEGIPERVRVGNIEIASLLSDCYVNIGEDDAAENVRSELIAQLMLSEGDTSMDLLGRMYLNSALYFQGHDDDQSAYRYLSFVVEKWPDSTPALIAYGNFAYNSARRVMDDPLTQALRDAGVVSVDMKRFDDLPRVPVSDALARMKDALAHTNDRTLHVAILDLEDRVDVNADERVRLSKVWRLLEQNTISPNLYPPEVIQYALHILLSLEQYSDAKALFVKYLNARFGFNEENAYEQELLDSIKKMDLWEMEYAAYFAAAENDSLLSRTLYERVVYSAGNYSNRNGVEISPECDTQSAVNLAMIYSSTGNKDQALELYGAAGSRATDSYLKSEILYRLGCIYNARGNREDARHSLEYSLYLNPSNGNARLLLNELKATFQEQQ